MTTLVAASSGSSWPPGRNVPDTVIWVNGVEVRPAASFRVTMNSFLAAGGDGFTVFNEGTSALGGAQDIDALVAYFGANEPAGIPVPPVNRIVPLP